MNAFNNEKGEFGLIPLLIVLFGAVIIVSAQVMNSSDNSSLNISLNNGLLNITLNETILDNLSIISNPTPDVTNQSTNLNFTANILINATLPETEKNLSQIIEKNKNKLNNETQEYFNNIKDKKEKRKYIVKFRNSVDENKLVNVSLDKKIEEFKVANIRGKAEDIEDLIDDNETEFVELDQNTTILGDNIPFNILKVKADSAWNLSKGSGVKVAVLDTGIGLHDDLSIAGGVSFVDNNYYDSSGHGTAVAGVIAALLNDEGLAGVAPDVSLYSVKIMQSSTGDLSNAIAGMEWAINNSMDVVSMSFGFDSYSQIFKEVLQEAYDKNILLVAASGNNGQDNILYPAAYDSVIAVGAVTANNNLAYFSSYGFKQELVALGVDINSTSLGNSYSTSSGTSLAAPHVAGVAALIKSFNNSLTNEQIRGKLRNDALDLGAAGKDDYFGYGLVQINLNTSNFTYSNNSYFYEIFNISNYGLLNQSYLFWLNGTGTVDYVKFSVGYYLVNITFNDGSKKSNIYNVSENGTIFILSTSQTYTDNFTSDGSSISDGIGWINEIFTVQTSTGISGVQAECYYFKDLGGGHYYDYCFFDTTTDKNNCDGGSLDIDCIAGHTQCSVGSMLVARQIFDTTFAHTNHTTVDVSNNCNNFVGTRESSPTITYNIIDRRAALCNNASNYNLSGWYGTSWIKIASYNCQAGSNCNNSSNYTSKDAYIDPCITQNTCMGTIEVITEDRNGNAMSNLLVTRDDASNKTTNSVGVADFDLSKPCSQNMNFVVRCSNASNAQICDSQTAKLDKVNDYKSLIYDCSVCSGQPDMQIDVNNIRVNKSTNQVSVNVSLLNIAGGTNVNITFKVQDKDGLISREASQIFIVNSGDSSKFITQSLTILDSDDFLHVYIDPNQGVSESNEKNNYALFPLFKKDIKAFLDVNTGYPLVDNAIRSYLKLFVIETSQPDSDVTIYVGKKSATFINRIGHTSQPVFMINPYYYSNGVYYNKNSASKKGYPYVGLVGGYKDSFDGRNYILAFGNDIDGDVAAVKKLISAKQLFLNKGSLSNERTVLIGDLDVSGISVADLLRNPSNYPYYNQRNSSAFAQVVDRILNNNNYQITIKTVQTLNTTSYNQSTILRLKNVNTDFSDNYKNVIINASKPIVMSGGIFSTLTTWENGNSQNGLANDLVNDGHDVWEIEMNGGTNTECAICPDYTYQDQVDYFWPVLVAGVMNYSGKNQVHYIGHSNGCRVALSSLNSYSNGKNSAGYAFNSVTGLYDLNVSLPNHPVDKFFGVACPATLNDDTAFTLLARSTPLQLPQSQLSSGDLAIAILREDQLKHVRMFDYSLWLAVFRKDMLVDIVTVLSLFSDEKISLNLMEFYNDLAINTSS